jgi:hypothetical protein
MTYLDVYILARLPVEWKQAEAAFKCSAEVTIADVAQDAVDRHIAATMSMYNILKGVRNGNG